MPFAYLPASEWHPVHKNSYTNSDMLALEENTSSFANLHTVESSLLSPQNPCNSLMISHYLLSTCSIFSTGNAMGYSSPRGQPHSFRFTFQDDVTIRPPLMRTACHQDSSGCMPQKGIWQCWGNLEAIPKFFAYLLPAQQGRKNLESEGFLLNLVKVPLTSLPGFVDHNRKFGFHLRVELSGLLCR